MGVAGWEERQAEEAVARAFGHAVDRSADPRVAALMRAGLSEGPAARVVASLDEGLGPEAAVLLETAFDEGGVEDRSVSLGVVQRRAVVALRSLRESEESARLRDRLRVAMSAAAGVEVPVEAAGRELERLRARAIREGLSFLAFKGLVAEEVDRLNGARGRGR